MWEGVGKVGRLVGGVRGMVRSRETQNMEEGIEYEEFDQEEGPGRLGKLIFGDGLIFFIIA
jgi:hypothetical protein